jgi:hypothetical protein
MNRALELGLRGRKVEDALAEVDSASIRQGERPAHGGHSGHGGHSHR